MTNDFLPKDYKTPSSTSNFMRLEEGENRIRILTNPKIGYVCWKDNKPIRREETVCSFKPEEADKDEKFGNGKPKINLFWAMMVWDYKDGQIKILEIVQKTVLKAIENLANDQDWGSPLGYDISINKVKNGERTTYTVSPKPAKPLSEEVKKAFDESDIDVNIIFGKGISSEGKVDYPEEDNKADQIPF